MIRRSTAIAAVAILLSLIAHVFGLSMSPIRTEPLPQSDDAGDVVAVDSGFEDLADAEAEPVEPEAASEPEPPVETPPEPEAAVEPTSEALLASPDPQETTSPDTGAGQPVEPDQGRPVDTTQADSAEPETVAPATADIATAPQAPRGVPDAASEPAETVPPEAVPAPAPAPETASEAVPPAPQVPAASTQAAPAIPVSPVPGPEMIALAPPVSEAANPVPPDEAPPSRPTETETVEDSDDEGGTALAVDVSLRPKLPGPRPAREPAGVEDGSDSLSPTTEPPQELMESPLLAYQRNGTDLTLRQDSGAAYESLNSFDARGAGNADKSNYAGQVLAHLNRAPAVAVSRHGSARVFFQINPDGSLAWVDIIDSSGSQEVESAAKAQVRSAAPFPPPPGGGSRKLVFLYSIR